MGENIFRQVFTTAHDLLTTYHHWTLWFLQAVWHGTRRCISTFIFNSLTIIHPITQMIQQQGKPTQTNPNYPTSIIVHDLGSQAATPPVGTATSPLLDAVWRRAKTARWQRMCRRHRRGINAWGCTKTTCPERMPGRESETLTKWQKYIYIYRTWRKLGDSWGISGVCWLMLVDVGWCWLIHRILWWAR